jgi:Rrf2 family cysteine metabolism transcriptional repressor
MRLSTKGEYASRALLEMALRYEKNPRKTRVRDIAQAQDIPERFLEQILLILKRAGYIRSKKGPTGGYYLAMHPSKIRVADVIRTMDGPLAPIDCVSATAHEVCPRESFCGLRWLWKKVRDQVADILENTTFEDLAVRTMESKGNQQGIVS